MSTDAEETMKWATDETSVSGGWSCIPNDLWSSHRLCSSKLILSLTQLVFPNPFPSPSHRRINLLHPSLHPSWEEDRRDRQSPESRSSIYGTLSLLVYLLACLPACLSDIPRDYHPISHSSFKLSDLTYLPPRHINSRKKRKPLKLSHHHQQHLRD